MCSAKNKLRLRKLFVLKENAENFNYLLFNLQK